MTDMEKLSKLLSKRQGKIGTVDIKHRPHPTLPGFVELDIRAALPEHIHKPFVQGIETLLELLSGGGAVAKVGEEEARLAKSVQECEEFFDSLPKNCMVGE